MTQKLEGMTFLNCCTMTLSYCCDILRIKSSKMTPKFRILCQIWHLATDLFMNNANRMGLSPINRRLHAQHGADKKFKVIYL